MPRRPRIQYPGAWHHVTNRGAARQDVFLDKRDRRLFLSLIGQSVERFGIEIHAYCLMGNHYHLLVRTPEPNLDLAVHHFASNYVRAFNLRHGRDGPLFRSRYLSILVQDSSYIVAVSRYIHRNPIDIGIDDLVGYEWSSLGAYVTRRRGPQWLHTKPILAEIGGSKPYEHLVLGPYGADVDAFYAQKNRPAVLGSESALPDAA